MPERDSELLDISPERVIVFREEFGGGGMMSTKLILKPGEGAVFTRSGIPKIYTSDEVVGVVGNEENYFQLELTLVFDPLEKRLGVVTKNDAIIIDENNPYGQFNMGDELTYLVIWGANSHEAESFFHIIYYGDEDI